MMSFLEPTDRFNSGHGVESLISGELDHTKDEILRSQVMLFNFDSYDDMGFILSSS